MNKKEAKNRIGVILAGGSGNRLFPATSAINKQLLPVYDKPMIYYPLTTLMLMGIKEFIIISQPSVIPNLQKVLDDGSKWGITITYAEQPKPDGVGHAMIIAEPFLNGRPSVLILGDNILYGSGLPEQLRQAATQSEGAVIFGYEVSHPEAFGVVTLNDQGMPISLEEKPKKPLSKLAVPGIYFYDENASIFARSLSPSARGEIEITDLNRIYMEKGHLNVHILSRGVAWLDGGTPGDLYEAAQFVRVIEDRTGQKISCPEEIAWRKNFINSKQLKEAISDIPPCKYREYLEKILLNNKESLQ